VRRALWAIIVAARLAQDDLLRAVRSTAQSRLMSRFCAKLERGRNQKMSPTDTAGPNVDLDRESLCGNSAATGTHRLDTRTAICAP
jgi:hypothetical protein